jgi:hypothetical protein
MRFFGYWLIVKGGSEKNLRRLRLEPLGEGAAAGLAVSQQVKARTFRRTSRVSSPAPPRRRSRRRRVRLRQ